MYIFVCVYRRWSNLGESQWKMRRMNYNNLQRNVEPLKKMQLRSANYNYWAEADIGGVDQTMMMKKLDDDKRLIMLDNLYDHQNTSSQQQEFQPDDRLQLRLSAHLTTRDHSNTTTTNNKESWGFGNLEAAPGATAATTATTQEIITTHLSLS